MWPLEEQLPVFLGWKATVDIVMDEEHWTGEMREHMFHRNHLFFANVSDLAKF